MFQYPYATVSQIRVPDAIWWELERRLALIFLGRTHSSSAVHEQVIAALEREGDASPRLDALRRCAVRARDALYAGDFAALGRAMIDNTDAQRALHPALVNADADAVIALAREHARSDGRSMRRRRRRFADPPVRSRRQRQSRVAARHPPTQPALPANPNLPQPDGTAGVDHS